MAQFNQSECQANVNKSEYNITANASPERSTFYAFIGISYLTACSGIIIGCLIFKTVYKSKNLTALVLVAMQMLSAIATGSTTLKDTLLIFKSDDSNKYLTFISTINVGVGLMLLCDYIQVCQYISAIHSFYS